MTDDFNVTEHELGVEAKKFIKERLSEKIHLAQIFMKIFDLEKSRVITALPLGMEPKEAKDFEDGILPDPPKSEWRYIEGANGSKSVMIPTPNMDFWLASQIRKFLTTKNNRLCILFDTLARPGDPWISLKKPQVFTLKDEIYHFLLKADIEDDTIEQAIKHARTAYFFIGAMTSVPQKTSFPQKGQEVSFEELKVFAERTEKIIIGAYDGEGHLIWEPS